MNGFLANTYIRADYSEGEGLIVDRDVQRCQPNTKYQNFQFWQNLCLHNSVLLLYSFPRLSASLTIAIIMLFISFSAMHEWLITGKNGNTIDNQFEWKSLQKTAKPTLDDDCYGCALCVLFSALQPLQPYLWSRREWNN